MITVQPSLRDIKKMINDAVLSAKKAENPVGHIRMETTNTNPATYLGFGTWVLWGSGRVPVGVNTGDADFETVEKTGGEKTHKLTISEMPSHQHGIRLEWDDTVGWGPINATSGANANINDGHKTAAVGGSQAHNNLQPYITCYMWKRTA